MERERNRVHARLAGDLAGRGVGALAKELELGRKRGGRARRMLVLICLLLCVFFCQYSYSCSSFSVAFKVVYDD